MKTELNQLKNIVSDWKRKWNEYKFQIGIDHLVKKKSVVSWYSSAKTSRDNIKKK